MFNFNGKPYYSFAEASRETGYTEGTIRTYVSKNQIEAEKLDGGFALTELGMKQLRIKKNREDNTIKPYNEPPVILEPEEPDNEPNDKLENDMAERAIHFRTPEALTLYDKLMKYAEMKGISPKELAHSAIDEYLTRKQTILTKIEFLEQQIAELKGQL